MNDTLVSSPMYSMSLISLQNELYSATRELSSNKAKTALNMMEGQISCQLR